MTGGIAAGDNGMIVLRDPRQVDLSRHAVIEASAGTGKTFMIEQIARRLVVEKGESLSKILIVTFTEKATGELKRRLRKSLAEALEAEAGNAKLAEAIDSFDEAPIQTIHGFCQRVLRQYAFENRQPMATDLVQDRPVFERALREIQRRDWARQEPEAFAEFLEACGYPTANRNGSDWEERVLGLAGKWRPDAGDVLLPEPLGDLDACVGEWRRQRGELVRDVLGLLKPDAAAFLARYENSKKNRTNSTDRLADILKPTVELLVAEGAEVKLARWRESQKAAERHGYFKDKGFGCLCDVAEVAEWPELFELSGKLSELDALLTNCQLLSAYMVGAIRREAAISKRLRSQISYDDMISQLRAALDPDVNPGAAELVKALRRQFSVALVDEFQDTDPVQWEIFRRIFVGSPGHRLMVIGDPKQAIYSFRGADLHTYQRAVAELRRKHGAVGYELATNWRSTPALIGALNRLFIEGKWFDDGVLACGVVSPPEDEQIRTKVIADRSGRAAVSAVRLMQKRVDDAKREFALFVAAEVKRLLCGAGALEISIGGEKTRALNAGDVCVLVDVNRDAELVEEILREKGVPCSYYKKPKLWGSTAALHVLFLLRALARPGDEEARTKALLTHFFRSGVAGIQPADLIDGGIGPGHPAMRALARWHEMALERNWGRLFGDILTSSGILLDEIRTDGGDRRIADYREIFDRLEEEAARDALDIAELVGRMAAFRAGSDEISEEEGLHVIETDRPKVQILTAHKSKGLEYPVVFVAGGFSSPKQGDTFVFHDDANGDRRTIDLACNDASKKKEAAERAAESARVFYVALTRAMVKLYVPYREEVIWLGISRIVRAWNAAMAKESVDAQVIDCDTTVIEGEEVAVRSGENLIALPDATELMPVAEQLDRRRSVRVFSFSGLKGVEARALHGPMTLDDRKVEAGAEDEPEGGAMGIQEVVLAPGTEAGNLLHGIFQTIGFADVAAAGRSEDLLGSRSGEVIKSAVERYLGVMGLGRGERDGVAGACAELVFRSLQARLPWVGRLCDLKSGDYLREMDFHLHLPALARGAESMEGILAGADGYITGQIDLVCRVGGGCFIVDYKSNALADFGAESLEAEMRGHRYPLQRAIYAAAVEKWIGKSGGVVAGALYLFVRGIGNDAGVVAHPYKSAGDVLKEFDLLASPRLAEELARGGR